ncbi:MAG: beta-ketoacyl-ACP synthase III [Planctomycetota bacterium]
MISQQATAANTGLETAVAVGVEIAGVGHHAPEQVLSNDDLAEFMDTSDEWIRQRTGIRQRHVCDPTKGESATWLSASALKQALDNAGVDPGELDQLILATVTGEMLCPSTACRVAAEVGARGCAAMDLVAACSGFVYGLNLAHDQIRAGSARTIAVVGCDVMSTVMDYSNRAVSVLFGDAAGAAVLRACDDPARGKLASCMHADGSKWRDLYIPTRNDHIPQGADRSMARVNSVQMNGREIYKFAVGTFSGLIQETLDRAGLNAHEVDHYVCHQSNARMLEAARERFGLPTEKMYINIDRYGNCSAGSVPTALSELRAMGRAQSGETVMFVAFGGGLTWASSLWQL